MSKAKLRKVLAGMDKDEIIAMVGELYDARKEAREYLEYWIEPDAEKELERVEKLVDRQFFTPQGKPRRSVASATVNRMVKDFMSICFEPERVARLLLFVAERMADWLEVRYRRTSSRATLRKYMDEAALYIEAHELEPIYGLRLERLRERVTALDHFIENQPVRHRYRW